MNTKDIVFEEFQQLNRKYLLLILIPINLFLITSCIFQIVFGKFGGTNPILIIATVLFLLFTIIAFLLCLETFVDGKGVYIRIQLCPFLGKSKNYLWDDIFESDIINSIQNPIIIRKKLVSIKLIRIGSIQHGAFETGPDGMKIIISGNIGLQLILKNGKKILIGTNNPDELSKVLHQLGKVDKRQYG